MMRADVHCLSVEPEGMTDLSRDYQSLLITTGGDVVLVDAPEPLVQDIEPAASDVTDEPIRH